MAYSDLELIHVPDSLLDETETLRKRSLLKKPHIAPLKISRKNPTFLAKMKKLADGIVNENNYKIREITEYFKSNNILLEYLEQSNQIKLIAQGAVPLYFDLEEFI